MSLTTNALATVADADPAPPRPGRQRNQVLPAIALGIATVAAILSVVAVATVNNASTTPPQPAGQQQTVPAVGTPSRGLAIINVDACGRPIISGRPACR